MGGRLTSPGAPPLAGSYSCGETFLAPIRLHHRLRSIDTAASPRRVGRHGVGIALGAAVTLAPTPGGSLAPPVAGPSDVVLYRAEVDRIHDGEGYYQAAAHELTTRGYPTRSVFNWRTPLPIWLLGKLPAVVLGQVLLGGMSLALMLMAFKALAREEELAVAVASVEGKRGRSPFVRRPMPRVGAGLRGIPAGGKRSLVGDGSLFLRRALFCPAACALWLTGPLLLTILNDLFVMPVLWAGVLIGLSVCAYGLGRPGLGVAFGLAAVFFRELAPPLLPGVHGARLAARRADRAGRLVARTVGLARVFRPPLLAR